MGKLETRDQTEAALELAKRPYINGDRIGVFGWSYGGYMASNCLFQSPEVFKMAIAVAPVTNWRFYDNIYTERYMACLRIMATDMMRTVLYRMSTAFKVNTF